MRSGKRARDHYKAENEAAARIIGADPMKYPGLMQEWACAVLAATVAPPADADAGPLFRTAA
jgi:hypothetical protein